MYLNKYKSSKSKRFLSTNNFYVVQSVDAELYSVPTIFKITYITSFINAIARFCTYNLTAAACAGSCARIVLLFVLTQALQNTYFVSFLVQQSKSFFIPVFLYENLRKIVMYVQSKNKLTGYTLGSVRAKHDIFDIFDTLPLNMAIRDEDGRIVSYREVTFTEVHNSYDGDFSEVLLDRKRWMSLFATTPFLKVSQDTKLFKTFEAELFAFIHRYNRGVSSDDIYNQILSDLSQMHEAFLTSGKGSLPMITSTFETDRSNSIGIYRFHGITRYQGLAYLAQQASCAALRYESLAYLCVYLRLFQPSFFFEAGISTSTEYPIPGEGIFDLSGVNITDAFEFFLNVKIISTPQHKPASVPSLDMDESPKFGDGDGFEGHISNGDVTLYLGDSRTIFSNIKYLHFKHSLSPLYSGSNILCGLRKSNVVYDSS
jgi:hypothetical protein